VSATSAQARPVKQFLPLALLFAAIEMAVLAAIVHFGGRFGGAGGGDSSTFTKLAEQGMAIAVGASFFFGFLSSLTPCVFPMVPITVSIFGATEATSRLRGAALSATFVLGIATLFTPLGVASAMSGKLMGSALSNPWVLTGIALVFFALASSMFGAFEMTLPASLNNKLSTVGGVGFKGAFVLGLVMGLVAAPCTGPFLTGMVLWIATTKNVVLGSVSMFSFALGLGVLFFLAGTFAMNLPKGGAWMMGIKWGSGVVLAYMALSYLRDGFPVVKKLAHPGTTYGVVAAVVLFAGLVLGNLHVIAERRKSPIAELSKPLKLWSIVPAIVGIFAFISWIQLANVSIVSEAYAACPATASEVRWETKEADAIAKAKAAKKPVIIDFGAEWCKACKELDEQTWPDHCVRQELSRFVAIKVDATDDDDEETKRLTAKYKVVGLPTVILLDSEGNEKARFNKFVPPPELVPAAKGVD
jgi:thiol:disulfide interchange protein DsbD